MAQSIKTGEPCDRLANGFTLIELMIVVSIVGLLATIAAPTYQTSVLKAREVALRQDLFTLRDLMDQHRADQGRYPASLQALASAGYLRKIPTDPLTGATTSWQEISEPTEGGIFDVYSGSDLVGTNGVPYNQW